MKTERRAGAVRFLNVLILAPSLLFAVTGCGGGYSSGGGGGATAPYITTQPTSQTVPLGQTATFSVVASGTAPLSYQWRKGGNDISGATSSSYTTPATTNADSGDTFDVVVSNSAGSVTSNTATLTVNSGSGSSTGWTWIQDSNLIFCQGSGRTSCNPGLGNITPTVTGSVWILQTQSPSNVSISSINPGSGGGTWIHCVPCHVTNPSGLTADVWYNLTGNAGFNGANPFGFTLTGSAGSFFGANFVELLPPPGSTASLDVTGTATPTNCVTCAGPTLNLTATDAVWMNPGGGPDIDWNSSGSGPYFTDYNGGVVGLNIQPGSTTISKTFATPPNQNPEFTALAFKSSLGTFSVPAKQYAVANFKAFVPSTACSTCTVPIPATTAGNLLVVEAANEVGSLITSISGGGTWVVPSQCQAKQVVQGTNNTISCAYNLSATGGVTSLSVTMQGGSVSHGFAVTEFSAVNGGTWSLDAIGATLNTPNASCGGFCYPGQPLTLTGNDVVVQTSWDVGESEGDNYFPLPTVVTTSQGAQGPGPANTFFAQNASIAILTDIGPPMPTPTWLNAVQNQNTFATGIAFTAH